LISSNNKKIGQKVLGCFNPFFESSMDKPQNFGVKNLMKKNVKQKKPIEVRTAFYVYCKLCMQIFN